MITRAEILMGREVKNPLDPALEANLAKLLIAVNKLRALRNKPMHVSSGYRPGSFNTKAGGSKRSAHLSCEAVDFSDKDGQLKAWITEDILISCGLYMEAGESTPTWVHVQIRPTKARIFKPFAWAK